MVRELVIADMPFRPGTAPPASRLPELRVAGAPGWREPYLLADSLRLDVMGLQPDADLSVAQAIGERLLRAIRLVARQWWVTRGHSESLAPLQHHFPIDSLGQPSGGQLYASRTVVPWLQTEALLTQDIFGVCCRFLESGGDVPVSAATLFDAVFSSAHQDRPAAVLLAAIACETLFSEQAYAASSRGAVAKAVVRSAVKTDDLRERVDDQASIVFGRSFRHDHPNEFDALSQLWVARHAVAHGSQQQQARSAVLTDQTAFGIAFRGALAFFHWMATITPRNWPDPMQAFVHPLTPVDV